MDYTGKASYNFRNQDKLYTQPNHVLYINKPIRGPSSPPHSPPPKKPFSLSLSLSLLLPKSPAKIHQLQWDELRKKQLQSLRRQGRLLRIDWLGLTTIGFCRSIGMPKMMISTKLITNSQWNGIPTKSLTTKKTPKPNLSKSPQPAMGLDSHSIPISNSFRDLVSSPFPLGLLKLW